MPKGNWRPFTLAGEEASTELAHPVLRLRSGAILPVGSGGQSADEACDGPITLLVSLDEHGQAEGRLYEDDGDGFGHREGNYLLSTYRATLRGDRVEVRVTRRQGQRPARPREPRIRVL
jgi:alpha-glucosidase